jgi:hypothetical protein
MYQVFGQTHVISLHADLSPFNTWHVNLAVMSKDGEIVYAVDNWQIYDRVFPIPLECKALAQAIALHDDDLRTITRLVDNFSRVV